MLRGCTDRLNLLIYIAHRVLATSVRQGLPDPLSQSHVLGSRHALNLLVFRVLKDHLQPFSHAVSLFDSLA